MATARAVNKVPDVNSAENARTECAEIKFDGGNIETSLTPSIVALKVLTELICETREYVEFDDDMKFGLGTLMEYCLADQKKELEAFMENYRACDIGLIEGAETGITMITQGAWMPEVVHQHINKTVEELDTVIQRNGKFKVVAEKMKKDFMEQLLKRGAH